jgi:GAF domain-containing protein
MLEASYLLVSAEKITLYMIDADKEELVAMTRGGYYQQQQQQQQQQSQQQQEQGLGAASSSGPNNNDVNSPNAPSASSPQRFSINRGILGFCATSGKLVNTSDARRDWRFDPEVDAPGGDGDVKSMLVVPVTDHLSKPIAIIQAVNKISYAHPFNAAPITGGSGNGSNSIGPGHHQRQHQPQHPGFRDRRVSFSGNSLHSGKTGGSNWGASGGVGVGSGGSGGGGHLTTQLSHQLPYFTRDEEALLQSMAVSAGIILRKARALEEALLAKKRADALLQISELMSADLQSDKIMAKIVQAAYMLVRCEYILLYMVDEAKGELVCEVGKDGSKGSRIPLGHGVAGHTALTGRTLNIHNAQNDWRFEPSEHAHLMGGGSGKGTGSQSGGVRTILAIPIKDYLGKNVGVLEIINKRSPSSQVVAFTTEDEDVLNSLAYTAGAVLRKAALFDQSVQAQKRSNALLQISEIMSAEIGSEAIMKRIIEASYALVDAERITLFTVDPKTGELVCQVSKDPFFQGVRMGYGHGQSTGNRNTHAHTPHQVTFVRRRACPRETWCVLNLVLFCVVLSSFPLFCLIGIVGHVALTRRSLNITDAYSDPRFNQLSDMKTGYKTRSILTVPVTDRKGQAVAVVQAVNKRSSSHFTSEDVLLLESMAVNAGMLLSRSRLYDAAVVADRKSRALVRLVMTATREDQSTEWIMHEVSCMRAQKQPTMTATMARH